MPRVYVSAGETSGDLHAGLVVRELLARDRGLEVFGMGGEAMASAGCEMAVPVAGMDVMGFAEVIWNIPHIWGVYRRTVSLLERRRPDVAVLVDYPGYHMRLARRLRELGVPVVLYIAPQVWAWRPGRARKVAETATKLLVIFDFEVPIFREAGADVEFVGHPILDELDLDSRAGAARAALGIGPDVPLVALLPGTRRQVLRRLLPVFLETARQMKSLRPEAAVAVGTRDGLPLGSDLAAAHDFAPPVRTHDLLRDANAGLLASGTVTLEAALLGCPGVVGYVMGGLNYLIGKRVVRTPHISLANIVLGEEVYPELIQHELRPAAAAVRILELLTDEEKRAAVVAKLKGVRGRLGSPGASARAAEAILKLL